MGLLSRSSEDDTDEEQSREQSDETSEPASEQADQEAEVEQKSESVDSHQQESGEAVLEEEAAELEDADLEIERETEVEVEAEDGATDDQEAEDVDKPEEAEDTDMPESVEVEVVDDTPEEPEDLEPVEFDDSQLATFTANFGEFSFKLIPESRSSGIRWVVAVYASGVQGSLFRTDKQITDAQADEFGLPDRLQERLNEALRFSNEELTLPAELQSELKSKSLEDLERLKEMTEQEA